LQVHWVGIDTGLKQSGETFLYNALTEVWSQVATNPYGARGDQATSTANSETVALGFSLGTAYANNWTEYQLSTDTWINKGDFDLKVINDDGDEVTFIRYDAAGAEI